MKMIFSEFIKKTDSFFMVKHDLDSNIHFLIMLIKKIIM